MRSNIAKTKKVSVGLSKMSLGDFKDGCGSGFFVFAFVFLTSLLEYNCFTIVC